MHGLANSFQQAHIWSDTTESSDYYAVIFSILSRATHQAIELRR